MAGLESARMFKPETMIEQQHTNGAPAAELQHGVDCPKAAHIEGRCDYLHDANDDNPYDDGGEAMNEHLVKIREICEFLRQVVPICYLRAIQHKLDEIVAEADAIKAILEREGL